MSWHRSPEPGPGVRGWMLDVGFWMLASSLPCTDSTNIQHLTSNIFLLSQLGVTKTAYQMVVHHSGRLHESVADRRAHELEPAAQQFLAHRVGLRCPRRNLLVSGPGVHFRLAIHKSPDERVKAAQFI